MVMVEVGCGCLHQGSERWGGTRRRPVFWPSAPLGLRYPDARVHDEETSLRPVTIQRRPAGAEPLLRVVHGAAAGQERWLRAPESIVGRDEAAALHFTDRGLSRQHAKVLRASDGIVSVLDLGSTNGTFINGSRVELCVLREGDRVQFGPVLTLQLFYEVPAQPRSHDALPLSARQIEIGRLVARGLTNAEIATALGISVRTVTSHLDHIYVRLEIGSRAALTRLIVEAGLMEPQR